MSDAEKVVLGTDHAVMLCPQPGSVPLWSGLTCSTNACRFQNKLILRMQKGERDEHGQLTFEPCNLETAMGHTVKADENFIISQLMRGVPNARRFGLRGRQYAPSLSEDDPLMEQIRRMRTLFSSAQRLRGETKQINDCLPQLKDLDNPLAIQGLRNLDIEQQIHAADPNDMPLEMVGRQV